MGDMAWEVVGKRWARCIIWQTVAVSFIWIIWELLMPELWSDPLLILARYFVLLVAQFAFVLGQMVVVTPEDIGVPSPSDLLWGSMSLAWKNVLGEDSALETIIWLEKIRALTRRGLFCLVLCPLSGSLSLIAFASYMHSSLGGVGLLDMGFRGAFVGFYYALHFVLTKHYILRFPIVQRHLLFSVKLGMPAAVTVAFRLALLFLILAEIPVRLLHSDMLGIFYPRNVPRFSIWHQIVFFVATFFSILCWNACHNLIQVTHTTRYAFAPRPGSAAAETDPSRSLLSALEDADGLFLQYLAYLDLYTLSGFSEKHVESWRRAALFEESGETYRRVIAVCLRPLDNLTSKLSKGLENLQTGQGDIFKQQQPTIEQRQIFQLGSSKDIFQDFQLCAWCAQAAAALTAYSHKEDKYGVAQLTGSNSAVLSSLLSCLLVLEVYLGRRNSFQALSFVGPNGIKWAVPFRGAFMDIDRRQSLMFRKKSELHKKTHAMADVVCTSIYRITCVFLDEMMLAGPGKTSCAVAERDWLSRSKPVYGTYDMHAQKLYQFLDFRE